MVFNVCVDFCVLRLLYVKVVSSRLLPRLLGSITGMPSSSLSTGGWLLGTSMPFAAGASAKKHSVCGWGQREVSRRTMCVVGPPPLERLRAEAATPVQEVPRPR